MPNRDLLYSPLAQRDLDEIFDYIATELENPSSAAGTVNAILDAAESLVGFPYTGSPVRGLPFTAEEYRFTNTRNYWIFMCCCRNTDSPRLREMLSPLNWRTRS